MEVLLNSPPPTEPSLSETFGLSSRSQSTHFESYDHYLEQILNNLVEQNQDTIGDGLADAFVNVERAKREWEATVDALPELICVVDEHGHLVRANRTVEKWSLGTVRNVKGHELHRFLHPSCKSPCWLAAFIKSARRNALTGQSTEVESYDAVLRRHLLVRVMPVRTREHDAQRHSAVILQDITRRKEMEAELKRNNRRLQVLNAISSAILAARFQEEIAEAVLKHMHPLVPYQQAYVLIYDQDRSKLNVLASATEDLKDAVTVSSLSARVLGRNLQAGTSEMYLVGDLDQQEGLSQFEEHVLSHGARSYISAPLIAANQSMGVLVVAMDSIDDFTPEQIQILREVAEMLTVAIRQTQLYRRLQQTNDELHGLLRMRHEENEDRARGDGSIHNVSKGRWKSPHEDVFGPLTASQIAALDELRGDGDQLLFMVNGLFRMRTVSRASMEKVTLNAASLIEDELEMWHVPAINHDVKIILQKESQLPEIAADPNRMREAISSLLDNALSNSRAGDSIMCRVWNNENRVMYSISDEGAAIRTDDLDRMFSRYHRAGTESPHTAIRLGLGLMRCEAIVEAHGGEVWAESGAEGTGNTFFVALPVV